jgi:hypothetical protein
MWKSLVQSKTVKLKCKLQQATVPSEAALPVTWKELGNLPADLQKAKPESVHGHDLLLTNHPRSVLLVGHNTNLG